MHQADIQFYINELNSNGCICEREKEPGKAFCIGCNNDLPRPIQNALKRSSIENGYPETYEAAVEHLTQYTERIS